MRTMKLNPVEVENDEIQTNEVCYQIWKKGVGGEIKYFESDEVALEYCAGHNFERVGEVENDEIQPDGVCYQIWKKDAVGEIKCFESDEAALEYCAGHNFERIGEV